MVAIMQQPLQVIAYVAGRPEPYIHTYMTVCMEISLPKMPYIHRTPYIPINVWFWPTLLMWRVGALESPARKSVCWSPQADAGASLVWEEREVGGGTMAGGCAGKPCTQECRLEPTSRRWCKCGVGGGGGGTRDCSFIWVRWKALPARVSAGAHKQTLVQVWCGRRGRWYQGLQLHTALTMQNNLELGNVCFCQSLIQSQSLLLVTSDYGAYDAE